MRKLKIFCYLNHLEKKIGLYINSVTCLFESDRTLELMKGEEDEFGGVLLSDEIENNEPADHPIWLTFRFYIIGSVGSYPYQRCDIRMGKQLWKASEEKHLTGVEFIVGDRSFWAHKFILAARSLVLRAMFGADMIESRTGRVRIDDGDPDIFQQFLHFVYTGQLDGKVSPELGYVAEKYNVETLSALCQMFAFGEENDAEDMFASIRFARAMAGPLDGDRPEEEATFWSSDDTR